MMECDIFMNDAKISSLTSLLTSYTTQLEEYERACGTFTLSVISAIVAVITIAVSVCSIWKASVWVIIVACLVIPCLEMLFLFVFSHYTRRVAFYRGYCIYLEQQLNKLTGGGEYFFHQEVKVKTMRVFKYSTSFMVCGLLAPYMACFFINVALILNHFSGNDLVVMLICSVIFFVMIGMGLWSFIKALGDNEEVVQGMVDRKREEGGRIDKD